MTELFWISPVTAMQTVIATTVICLAFVVLVRVIGARSIASLSTFDFACFVAFGAVIGRTTLSTGPTLMTGVVALATLFVVQGVLGILRTNARLHRWLTPAPVVLVRDGVLQRANLRRTRVDEDELRRAVRRAGHSELARVGLAVLEPNGSVSVISSGSVDDWLLADIPGQHGK